MTSMISDETLQKIQDKLEELSHKIKALELLKLSMSSLENQTVDFNKVPQIMGVNILSEDSVLNLGAYGTANAESQTVGTNGTVVFVTPVTVSGGVGFNTVSGEIDLPAGGSYLISIDLDADSTSTANSVVLTDNSAINLDIITATKSSGAANFIVNASSNLSLFIKNTSGTNFICDGGSISVVRVGPATVV